MIEHQHQQPFHETLVEIDHQPHILRHHALNPIRNSVSLHTFLSRIDYLATSPDSPAYPPTRQSVSSSPELAIQILQILYSFAFEPRWAPHFFPRSAFQTLVDHHRSSRLPIVSLPNLSPTFTLASVQGEEGSEYGPGREGKPCGHVFRRGEGVYHCSECGIDPTCALCARCFLASDHTGHDVTYSIHATGCGCCDCGDDEAWKKDIKCKYHCLPQDRPNKQPVDNSRNPSPLPPECKNVIEQIVTIALDFLLITLDRSPEEMNPPADVETIYNELSRLEENAFLEMSRNPLSNLPDDSMDLDLHYSNLSHHQYHHLHHQPHPFQHRADPVGDSHHKSSSTSGLFSALLGGARAHDKGKGKITDPSTSNSHPPLSAGSSASASFGLLAGDMVGRFGSSPRPVYSQNNIPAGSSSSSSSAADHHWPKWAQFPGSSHSKPAEQKPKGAGPWGVVLWNDEKHSYAQVIDEVSKATGCSRTEALRVANTVDTKGREVIQVSSDPNVLLQTSKIIGRIDLTVTVRTAHDLFCEQIADMVINFLVDLASCRIYNCSPEDDNWIKSLIAQKLCQRPEIGYEGGDRTRFARLLLNDIKLWKEGRDRLKVLYISLLSLGQSVKLQLGILFASVFPQLIDYNLLIDREPDHNILLFSLQIVTVPSVIVVLVTDHGFLAMIVDLLFSFFTQQFLPVGAADNEIKHIIYPPDYSKRTIDPESISFRHKRYYHLYHELNLVIGSSGVQSAVSQDVKHLKHLLNFLDLFTNMNPNKRAVHLHVEFESDAWVTAFNVTIQLAKLCKFFGECYSKATPAQFILAVRTILEKLMMREGHEFHDVQFGSCEISREEGGTEEGTAVTRNYRCIDFKTDRESISFHHPINWLLAELLRSIPRMDWQEMQQNGVESISDLLILPNSTPDEVDIIPLVVCEDVIRVSSLLAQVRAGLWVRNGFGVRAQQLHYREYSLRETTFDQDIFHLQVLLAAKDPSHVLVAIVDRFGLRQWCNGEQLSDRVYEPSQMIAMLEELLHLLIILLSEPSGILPQTLEESLRREIVHVLCLGPMSYSDIIKRIPDRYMQEFEAVLKKLTDFKQPTGTNDVGTYTLKPELLNDVDPYYCRFGRNQREESEKIVIEHLKKSDPSSDPVLVPRKLDARLRAGPFHSIYDTYLSDAFLQVIFYSLARVNPTMKGYSEYLADQAIHLVMMGLVERPQEFAKMSLTKKLPLKGANPHTMTLVMMLEAVDAEPAMRGVKKKVNWCLDRIAAIVGLDRSSANTKESSINAEQMAARADEQKKEAAKARQNAIMNQFAAAQQAFLLQHDLGDEDEDDLDFDDDDDDSVMNNSTGKVVYPVETEKVYGSCIVCQEDLTKSRCFGALGLIQTSKMMRITPLDLEIDEADKWFGEALTTPENLDHNGRKDGPSGLASHQAVDQSDSRIRLDNRLEPVPWTPLGFPTLNSTRPGLFASACGHMMHLACFQNYYKSIELRHGAQVTRNHPESIERCEYLCPLCKSIGNVFLPSIERTSIITAEESPETVSEWFSAIKDIETEMQNETGGTNYSKALSLTDQYEVQAWLFHDTLQASSLGRLYGLRSTLGRDERTMVERFLMVTGALGKEMADTPSKFSGTASLTRDLVGYTISCIEIANRGVDHVNSGGVESGLTETQRELISSLLTLLGWLIESESGTRSAKRFATGLLIRELMNFSGVDFEVDSPRLYNCPPIVFMSPISVLVHCATVCPQAFSLVIGLSYHIEVLRILLGLCYYSSKYRYPWWKGEDKEGEDELEIDEENFADEGKMNEGNLLKKLVKKLIENCAIRSTNVMLIPDSKMERLIRLYSLPFLRRAMLLKSVIMDSGRSETRQQGKEEAGLDEHARLRKKLGIPSLTQLISLEDERLSYDDEDQDNQEEFQREFLKSMWNAIRGWMHHLRTYSIESTPDLIKRGGPMDLLTNQAEIIKHLHLEHPVIYELVGLPRRFDKILSEAVKKKCGNCGNVPNDPGICLICGTTVCVQAFCCTIRNLNEEPEHGECNVHMWNCGGSIGVYLLIKKCSILYLSTENGTFSMAPYLDEHGEHDVGIKGRPQYLHTTRWDEIRKIWLQHSIPTFVARRQEATADVGGWPTF